MFAISITEIVISVNAGFILGFIRQCFSTPASSSCLVLPQITAGRKDTPWHCHCTPTPGLDSSQRGEAAVLQCCVLGLPSDHPSFLLASCTVPAECRSPHKAQVVVFEALFCLQKCPKGDGMSPHMICVFVHIYI